MRVQATFVSMLVMAFSLSLAPRVRAQDDPAELDPAPDRAWSALADGRTLNGWRQVCGDGGFRVEEGAIVGRPGRTYPSSYLVTERSFGDFLLEYEFRTEAPLNGGVQIRSRTRPLDNGVDVVGYQVEIDPSDRAWSGGIYEQGLRGWLAPLDGNDRARTAFRPGRWNRVRVLALGPRIRTWINGVPAADLLDAAAARGFIGLQTHTARLEKPAWVSWRGLRIKELGAGPSRSLKAEDWRSEGPGLAIAETTEALRIRLDDPTRGPGFLMADGELGDGALVLRFRLRRAGLHLVCGARDPDWQGGRGGVEIAIEPPAGGTLWRGDGTALSLRRGPIEAVGRDEALAPHELVVIRCGDRLVARLDGEALHDGEIRLRGDEGRGPVWGLLFPASRTPVIDLLSARFLPLADR